MSDKYNVQIIMRDGMGQTPDDYHATVIRNFDQEKLIFISQFRTLLKWKIRRKALDRAFKSSDKRQKKLAKMERYEK